MPTLRSLLTGVATALLSASAAAHWTFDIHYPGGVGRCPPIAEPFLYYADTCEFLALTLPPGVQQGRADLWADQLVQSAVVRGTTACMVPYVHYLWIDNLVYPMGASAIVQHNRPYLSVFSLTLDGCQRANGSPVVENGPQRLLLANIDVATAGEARWYFDPTAGRAYLRLQSSTGDVLCQGGQTPPNIPVAPLFANGFE